MIGDMRKNNVEDMTVVEQLVAIREATCEYVCKFKDKVREEKDPLIQKIKLQGYCHYCPLTRVNYEGER